MIRKELESSHSAVSGEIVTLIDKSCSTSMRFMLDFEGGPPYQLWERIGAIQLCLERGMNIRIDVLKLARDHCIRLQDDSSFIKQWHDREGIQLAIRYTADALSDLISRYLSIDNGWESLTYANLYTSLKRRHLLPYERRMELQERIIKSRVSPEHVPDERELGAIPQVLSILQTNMLVDDEVFDHLQHIALKKLESQGIVEWREGDGAWRIWRVENIVWHREARLDWRLPGMDVKVSTSFIDESYHVNFSYDRSRWTFLTKAISASIADYGAAGFRAEKIGTGDDVERETFDYHLAFENEFRARDFIQEIMEYLRGQKEKGA
jgi:hypothetical protein